MWESILSFAETTTARVGVQLLKDFGTVQAAEKLDGSLVTQSDQWADQEIREAIISAFPTHGVLSEEGEHVFPDNEWCWIIDPLDGTTNFARGIPIWGISMGLLYQGTPVFGYVHLVYYIKELRFLVMYIYHQSINLFMVFGWKILDLGAILELF